MAHGVFATAARDGGVRLWRMPLNTGNRVGGGGGVGGSAPTEATLLFGLAPYPGVAATALAFDSGGHRLFVGFADGMVREMQVNLGQDAAGGAGLARLFEAAGGGEGVEAPGLSASSSLRPLRECKAGG